MSAKEHQMSPNGGPRLHMESVRLSIEQQLRALGKDIVMVLQKHSAVCQEELLNVRALPERDGGGAQRLQTDGHPSTATRHFDQDRWVKKNCDCSVLSRSVLID